MFKAFRTFATSAILIAACSIGARAATTRYVELRSTLQPYTTGAFSLFLGSGTIQYFNASTATVKNATLLNATISTGNVTSLTATTSTLSSATINNLFAANSTFTAQVGLRPATDQIIFGNPAGNRWTFSAPAPISGNMTVTLPTDTPGSAAFVLTDGAQTIGGIKSFSSSIGASDGTLALPGFNFSSDTNTGFRRSAADTFHAVAGGVDQASFTATGSSLRGTTTNDNAAAGWVGQSSITAVTSFINFPTTGQYGDLASFTLTAGDWDIAVNFESIANGATVTDIRCGIGTASGNSSTGLIEGDNTAYGYPPTAVITSSLAIPSWRVSLSGSTTYYLKYRGGYSVAIPQAVGRMSARRVR